MKRTIVVGLVSLIGLTTHVRAEKHRGPVVVTATNAATNQLLVYDTAGSLLQTLSTRGQGGVGGNAGGVTSKGDMVAAVNFGSNTVAIFDRKDNGLQFRQLLFAAAPVSAAFGEDHLYVLGTTSVASHRVHGSDVSANPDGLVSLLLADGSAAQVGVLAGQLIITEKSNVVETVTLDHDGAVTGTAALVGNIPANVDTPFGLVTRGNDAYVTIAHADEISLVRNGQVLTTTPSVTQHAPCWLTLTDQVVGSFLYSSNSPSKSISRYAVYGQKIVQDLAVAATLNGSPTDIASVADWLAVIDANGGVSHVSVFHVDQDGNLILGGSASIPGHINGVAIVGDEDEK